MTTTEPVIPSSDQHTKAYDVFGLVRGQPDFISSAEINEPFRIRIVGIEGTALSPIDLEVSVALAAYGAVLTPPLQTAHSSSNGKIEEWVFFPITYAELPLDTMVSVTVKGPTGIVVGGCTFYVFTSRGASKRGTRKYALHRGAAGDHNEVTLTPGHTDTTAWQHLARDFRQNRMPQVPWLDAIAMTRIRITEADAAQPVTTAGSVVGGSSNAAAAVSPSFDPSSSFLMSAATSATFARMASQVNDDSMLVNNASIDGMQAPKAAPDRPSVDSSMHIVVEFPGTSTGHPLYKTSYSRDLAEAKKKQPSPWATDATPFAPFPDLGVGSDNLCELKAVHLGKSTNAVYDPQAKPSLSQRRQIQDILRIPPISVTGESPLSAEQSALLWNFRHYIAANDPQLFTAVMSVVDWTNAQEEAEATSLLPLWKNLSLSDALAMLATSIKPLRVFATQILAKQSNATLVLLLLQLVQAMRFDTEDNELFSHLLDRATQCWRLASFMFWYLNVEADLEETNQKNGGTAVTVSKATQAGLSSTRIGFVRPSQESYHDRRLAMLAHLDQFHSEFHRRLVGQQQLRSVLTALYSGARGDGSNKDRSKMAQMTSQAITEGRYGIKELFAGDAVVYLPPHPHLAIKGISEKGVYIFKSAKMPVKLEFQLAGASFNHDEDMSLAALAAATSVDASSPKPLNSAGATGTAAAASDALNDTTTVSALSAAGDDASIGAAEASASAPALSTVDTMSEVPRQTAASASPASPAPPGAAATPPSTIAFMFKCGDDVRQDQLVIQFIELMDQLLKQNGLNLHLTPYRALATSQQDGFVEMVLGCETFQNVQEETVLKYLKRHNPAPADYERAVDRFVKSTAGYCVVTFLLGIGDRHLENLLITQDGRLFHVDFGFIMGKDPKPFPPPMKLNNDMVEAMGGANGRQYRNFRAYCCSAFNTLRKSSHLLLNLLLLMSDASIPHLDDDGKVDPRVNIARVQEKLRLDLNDAEASQYFNGVINDSLGARLTNLWDIVHKKVQEVRN